MAKRRFLPTRRELYQYINNGEISDNEEDDDENKPHFNAKRYFLKSKRYFLNSKRDDDQREEVSALPIYFIINSSFSLGINAHQQFLHQYKHLLYY